MPEHGREGQSPEGRQLVSTARPRMPIKGAASTRSREITRANQWSSKLSLCNSENRENIDGEEENGPADQRYQRENS